MVGASDACKFSDALMAGHTFNVLITAAGRRVSLVRLFQESLRELGLPGRVFAGDATAASSAMHVADRAFVLPPVSDADFVPVVVDLCQRNKINLVVPTIDTELPIWASSAGQFTELGVTLAVSSPEVIEIAADKVETHRWLMERGFPVPRQASAEEVLTAPEQWKFPLVVKPRRGSASKGVILVHDSDHLRIATYDGEFVVQSFAFGNEYTVDILVGLDSRTRCVVPRRRIEVRDGEVSKGIVERCHDVEELAWRLGDALRGAYAVLNVQIIRDQKTGRMRVIEINPRFGGGFPLTMAAGGRYPTWMIEELLKLPSSQEQACWRDRLVMLRYDEAVFVDASAAGL